MKLVYNPGNSPVSYDSSKFIDPESWAYVDDEDTQLLAEIHAGRLVELDVPDALPESVDPRALPALKAAVEDKQKVAQADIPMPLESAENDDKPVVRNTDSKNTPRPTSKSKNKEA